MSDLVISPKVGHIRWDQVRRGDELMAAGYEAGLESIPKICELIESVSNKETVTTGNTDLLNFLTH
jgi:predicted acylesterase/phospholipase RssA